MHTLTLPLALGPALVGQEPMFGMASAELAARPTTTVLRAGVVAADGSEMTITF
ncbi:MAG: hypothetical protein H7255_03455 [Ramlibacter sp.]|nr:hypothetical protein [Ramlibacter sp.]